MSLAIRAGGGDPRREADVVKYARSKVDPEKQMPDVLLLAAMFVGMGAVLLKARGLALLALVFICSSVSKANNDYDYKQLVQSVLFVFFAVSQHYVLPIFARNKLIKEISDASVRIRELRQAAGH